ncbi:MAG: nitronate monooxygenase [Candidatus Wallbacteria bacterium HGW-Wallbacteria-1]|jgi:nitronate monooxygenase|uniref:Nitronate monooxygenase n=1 Tax=Candidatus Wallbacteria bacterium HGW-Wallbacteria-1 TaxID=2013854 RepID=A0A2N1PLY9_9BACT|nr:MAG: nitronate monooxygenase [Candidatus Wallbacteria bacterium HGW-Wallbacteria-1]
MNFPELKIGKWTARVPIIQGGMGVGISRAGLASAVASAGAVGIIATVGLGLISPNYRRPADYYPTNIQSLREELEFAKANSGDGIFGVNCMVAITDYEPMVRTAAEAGAKIIISGAGLPLKLPEYTKDFPDVALVPIVSSGKALTIITKKWEKSYGRIPDAVIIESPNFAGGHLGSDRESVGKIEFELENCVTDVVTESIKTGYNIPVIAAGGIWDRQDIEKMFSYGASGVQMATRFVCTHECDAPMEFKQVYLNTESPDEIILVQSPVGLPGRAFKNLKFMTDPTKPNPDIAFQGCFLNCLKKCTMRDKGTGFCIARALERAARGDVNDGLVFMGSNAYKCDEIISVEELIRKLTT